MGWIRILLLLIRGIPRDRTELVTENLARRPQLTVLTERKRRPKLRMRGGISWVWLSPLWAG